MRWTWRRRFGAEWVVDEPRSARHRGSVIHRNQLARTRRLAGSGTAAMVVAR
jgi:hypothetical protein